MTHELLKWDIYEISAESDSLVGVSLRGKLRKYAVGENLTLLTENATDKENCVRFATLAGQDIGVVRDFLAQIIVNASIKQVLTEVVNPVLSKLTIITDEAKY